MSISDSFIIVAIVVVAAASLFAIPAIETAKRSDTTSDTSVQEIVTEYGNSWAQTEQISENKWNEMIEKIDAIGKYQIMLVVANLDENPAKKTSSDANETIKIGENTYYVQVYNSSNIEQFWEDHTDGKLDTGDKIGIEVATDEQTLYEQLQNSLYGTTADLTGQVVASYYTLIK